MKIWKNLKWKDMENTNKSKIANVIRGAKHFIVGRHVIVSVWVSSKSDRVAAWKGAKKDTQKWTTGSSDNLRKEGRRMIERVEKVVIIYRYTNIRGRKIFATGRTRPRRDDAKRHSESNFETVVYLLYHRPPPQECTGHCTACCSLQINNPLVQWRMPTTESNGSCCTYICETARCVGAGSEYVARD